MSILGIAAGVTGGKLALALFKKLWWSLPIIGLGIALMLTRHTLANTKHDRDQWKDTAAVRLANLRTTTESLNGARAQIDDNNKRIEAANAQLQTARQEAAAADARANARYEATRGAVARLEASAATKGLPPCKVSQEAAHALDGL
jgi:chromosome segregation ATPase